MSEPAIQVIDVTKSFDGRTVLDRIRLDVHQGETLVILGASASALGQLLLSFRFELNIVGGGIVTLFGLFMLGTIRRQGPGIRTHIASPETVAASAIAGAIADHRDFAPLEEEPA